MNDPTLFQPDGHLSELAVSLYAEHLVHPGTPLLPASIVSHTEECDQCKHLILSVSELIAEHPAETATERSATDGAIADPGTVPQWYRAAAAVLLMLGGYGLYQLAADFPLSTEYTAVSDIPVTIQQKESSGTEHSPADRWTPSANFEDLLNTEFRSVRFDVIAPRNGESITPPFTFRWSSAAAPVTLDIMSNTEETLLTTSVTDGMYRLKRTLPEGRYYWRIRVQDEMVYLGSFLIGRPQ